MGIGKGAESQFRKNIGGESNGNQIGQNGVYTQRIEHVDLLDKVLVVHKGPQFRVQRDSLPNLRTKQPLPLWLVASLLALSQTVLQCRIVTIDFEAYLVVEEPMGTMRFSESQK